MQCDAMMKCCFRDHNSSRCRKKTEPSINLEQTTPCTRAPAQNLLIRSVSLTTHKTKMIEYKYFSRSFCLLCLDPSTVREKWLINQRTVVRTNQLNASIYQNTMTWTFFIWLYIKIRPTSVAVVSIIYSSNIAAANQLLMINRDKYNDFVANSII